MLAGTDDLDLSVCNGTAFLRDLDLGVAAKVFCRQRFFAFQKAVKIAFEYEIAAKFAGVDADIDDVIGGAHRFLVVLDDEHRVADVAEVFEDLDQPRVVTRMQADARFVQNVKRADEQRAEICRELYPLGLAARKRRRETA